MKLEKYNMMNCDTESGVCEVIQTVPDRKQAVAEKPVKMLYFTDPICSSCWGIEPQLRKLKQEYGEYFDIEYRMGGLLKNWSEYGGTDVNGPHSVAQHWDEASAHYDMPIDGDLWKEDPLHSSYPSAIAFKAAQLQDREKAVLFLRKIKEMVFVEKKNIARIEHLKEAAGYAGLDIHRFEYDFHHSANSLFDEDLQMAREWGVRGFPTIYFIDGDDNRFKVYGSKPYKVYEQALLKLIPGVTEKRKPVDLETIFQEFDTVTAKEFSVFYDKNIDEAENDLTGLEQQGKTKRVVSKAGALWVKLG